MPRNPNIKRVSNTEIYKNIVELHKKIDKLSKKSSLDAYFWGGMTIIAVGIAFNYADNTNSVGLILMVAGIATIIISNILTERSK